MFFHIEMWLYATNVLFTRTIILYPNQSFVGQYRARKNWRGYYSRLTDVSLNNPRPAKGAVLASTTAADYPLRFYLVFVNDIKNDGFVIPDSDLRNHVLRKQANLCESFTLHIFKHGVLCKQIYIYVVVDTQRIHESAYKIRFQIFIRIPGIINGRNISDCGRYALFRSDHWDDDKAYFEQDMYHVSSETCWYEFDVVEYAAGAKYSRFMVFFLVGA